jgi:acyl-CoA thioester hydrolase
MYIKEFEIRWADIDANRHVANSAFVDLLTETRMSFLVENGFSQHDFEELQFGPVIFSEEMYYLKEVMPNSKVTSGIELLASTEDFRYIRFAHYIFNAQGVLSVYSETFFGWFGLKERKLIVPPEKLQNATKHLAKAENYTLLDKNTSLKNVKIPFHKKFTNSQL